MRFFCLVSLALLVSGSLLCEVCVAQTRAAAGVERIKSSNAKLADLRLELVKKWPANRTIRFVFHGHSVPAGYFRGSRVRPFDSYPVLFHQSISEEYPTAVIDVSVTAIGGENASRGAKRFEVDVLAKKPDVVLIDYSLNDRAIGLERAESAWRTMIEESLGSGLIVVLLTPTPDSRENVLDRSTPLAKHALQVRRLGQEYGLPVIDSYAAFSERVSKGDKVEKYLSQPNHPNRAGHEIVAELLVELFKPIEPSPVSSQNFRVGNYASRIGK